MPIQTSLLRAAALIGSLALAENAAAASLTILGSFDGSNGAGPQFNGLHRDAGGNLLGTAATGGAGGQGTVYELRNTPAGIGPITTLYAFTAGGGAASGLAADPTGNLYGTTYYAGDIYTLPKLGNDYGAVSPVASLVSIGNPAYNGVVVNAAGTLYGNASDSMYQVAITAGGYGTPTVIYQPPANTTFAFGPPALDTAGNIYFVLNQTIQRMNATAGGFDAPITIGSFGGPPHDYQSANQLTIDANGNIFGAFQVCGFGCSGAVFEFAAAGSGYGPLQILAEFTGANGAGPLGGITLDAAGNLFGSTAGGGQYGKGTLFEIAWNGAGYDPLQTLFSFDGSNGDGPSRLVVDTAGNLYGTTFSGGAYGLGEVFAYGNVTVAPVPAPAGLGLFGLGLAGLALLRRR